MGRRCANCGRFVADAEDRRREGRHWFCSQSCFLQRAASLRSAPRRRGPAWRIVKWTGGVVALLFLALVVAALAGLGDTNTGKDKGKWSASSRLGSRANPVRFRYAAAVGEGWRLRVLGVTRNATRRVRAVYSYNEAPEAGGQDYLVRVAATYVGGGSSTFSDLNGRLKAMGRHQAIYESFGSACGGKLPSPDLSHSYTKVFSGHTVSGNICFQIASNDARSLRLFVAGPLSLRTLTRGRQVWFALS